MVAGVRARCVLGRGWVGGEVGSFGLEFGFGGLVAADVGVVFAGEEGVAGDGAAVVEVGYVFVDGGVVAGADGELG
ncbi:hypothetical protein FMUAM8_50010 [Nocardia cyriacigeorgica]|nr:hypothetical protein FMUAM8_50010 [Nocardia cyriacigeorgica]